MYVHVVIDIVLIHLYADSFAEINDDTVIIV